MIDCFPFFNELDLLEVRLHALSPYVDRFVLAECSRTHSGNPKPLFFEENKKRFEAFNITHIIIPPKEGGPWELESYGRECLLEGVGTVAPEEIVLISDLDEIPDLEQYSGAEGVFEQGLYYYYFNCFAGKSWRGSFAVKQQNIGRECIEPELRKRFKQERPVVGSGWHFSSLGSAEQVAYKIESYAHQELNNETYKKTLEANRENLIFQGGRRTKCSIESPAGPKWLLENKDKYPHLWYNNNAE